MAKSQRSVSLCSNLLLLLLLYSFVLANEARLLKPQSSIEMEIVKVLDDLCVEAVKTAGPRLGGDAPTNKALTLEGIKKSGPSPGEGH